METETYNKMFQLYKAIHACQRCVGAQGCFIENDPSKIMRKVQKDNLFTKVLVVGQALGGCTQRVSGLPYTLGSGLLSKTGEVLNSFLNTFGYALVNSKDFKAIYSTDLIQCWPGRGRRGNNDRIPENQEIAYCQTWLEEELNIIQPDVIIFLGSKSKKYMKSLIRKESIEWAKEYQINRWEKRISLYAIYHPAYRYNNLLREEVFREASKNIRERLHNYARE
ncbi:MAG: uracil-DNA glycosylase family protein [Candidatus Omnitrophica bacterium]|nr:uracil-DNA glycosylase family protein [Candidatus Omnitrophota bacterium]